MVTVAHDVVVQKRRLVETLIAISAVAGVVGAVVIGVLVTREATEPPPAAAPPTTTTPATTPAETTPRKPKATRLPPALVVKIDNVAASRPHVGLASADAIFVEPVEGGLTRLLAVYWGKPPKSIGPVRSARETDIELLAQIRKPVLAYSGSAPALKPLLGDADLVLATPDTHPSAFYRIGARPSPHNMFVSPARLPSTKAISSPLPSGKAPSGGTPATSHRVSFQAASYTFAWSRDGKRWRVSHNGSPLTSAEQGQLSADTVVVQRVRIVRGEGITDVAGATSPVARTVGSGKVTVLRGGRAYEGTWSRPKAARQTTYEMADGTPIPLAKGTVWVLLVPE